MNSHCDEPLKSKAMEPKSRKLNTWEMLTCQLPVKSVPAASSKTLEGHEIAKIIKVPLIKGGKHRGTGTEQVAASELRKCIRVNIPDAVSLEIGSVGVEVKNKTLLR